MTTIPMPAITPTRRAGGRSALRLLAPLLVFAVALAAVIGTRAVIQRHQDDAAAAAAAAAAAVTSMPTSAVIEEAWGIRFTAVNVLADGGMVEVRYLVLDPAKGSRIHSGKVSDLPYVVAEPSGLEVHSSSLMFHIHTDHAGSDVGGRAYSIIYGNSNGAAQIHGLVTVVLPDGLRLAHIPVS